MDPKGVKPPSEGMGVPPMMRRMMRRMGGTGELDPAAMCRWMMASAGEEAGGAGPEVGTLFEEWARGVEDEMLAVLTAKGPLDLAALAGALGIGPGSALHFLGTLVREGKAAIGSIRATGA